MSIGKRLYELRQALGLNQTDFGRPILLSQTTVGQMENETRAPSERTIVLTVDKWHCSDRWLRTGEGDMFEKHGDEFDAIAAQLNLNEFQRRMLRIVYEMPIEQQRAIRDVAVKIAAEELPAEEESDYDRAARIATAALRKYDEEHDEPEEDFEDDQKHA